MSRRCAVGVVLVGILGSGMVSACGSDDPPAVTVDNAQPGVAAPPVAPAPQTSTVEPTTPPPAAVAGTEAAGPSAPASDAVNEPAMATEAHEIPGVQVAIIDLRRTSGDTVTLRVTFRNTTAADISDSLFYGTAISSRTYLLDATRKKYSVLEDAEGRPVAYVGSSSTIKPGAAVPAWVRFPAPPPEVTTMTVVVPGVPPIEGVAVR